MSENNTTRRTMLGASGFVCGLLIGWLLFDNLALGLLFGIALSAANVGYDRATRDSDTD